MDKQKKFKIPRKPVNSGRGSQPLYERNENLINDYLDGMSAADLVAKYRITWQRIDSILRQYEVPRRRDSDSNSNDEKGGER